MFGSGKICIGGLPGVGSVGKIASDYLGTALDCSPIKTFFSSGFPAQVMVGDGEIEMLYAEILAPAGRDDIFILSGDAQPIEVGDMYALAGDILVEARSLGVTDVVTLAAYVGDAKERVFAAASDPIIAKEIEDKGIPLLRSGAIGGINGILAGLAPLYGLKSCCILGTTSGEVLVDIKAAICLLHSVKDLLGLDISVDGLEIEEVPLETSFEETDMNYR